jgi:hypothetical protein
MLHGAAGPRPRRHDRLTPPPRCHPGDGDFPAGCATPPSAVAKYWMGDTFHEDSGGININADDAGILAWCRLPLCCHSLTRMQHTCLCSLPRITPGPPSHLRVTSPQMRPISGHSCGPASGHIPECGQHLAGCTAGGPLLPGGWGPQPAPQQRASVDARAHSSRAIGGGGGRHQSARVPPRQR